jgi:hypothetical protein
MTTGVVFVAVRLGLIALIDLLPGKLSHEEHGCICIRGGHSMTARFADN